MCFDVCKNGCSVVLVRLEKWDTTVILRCFSRPGHGQTRALCVRESVTILWLERASLSRVLCQTMTMQRVMELKSDCQRENTSFSFRCGVNESVLGSWYCHVCCARLLTVDACPCCLLLSVIRHFFFSAVCILTHSRIVRGPVVCSAHECSQQGRWLLDWSRIGLCVRSLENKCWWWHACEHHTLRSSET